MSKTIEEARKTVQECEDQLRKINAAETKIEDRERLNKTQLAEIKDQIANVLASQALGEPATVEVGDLRRQRVFLQQSLEEFPLILKELKARKPSIAAQMREAERTLNRFDRYQTFKRQIEAGHGTYATQNDLKDYAKALDLEADCEAFLSKFGK